MTSSRVDRLEPPAAAPGFEADVETLRRRLGELGYDQDVAEDHALYGGLLRSTAAKVAPGADAVRRALGDADLAALETASHRLKGSAANTGAVDLAQACAELERAARAGRLPDDAAGAAVTVTRLADRARSALLTLADELDARNAAGYGPEKMERERGRP